MYLRSILLVLALAGPANRSVAVASAANTGPGFDREYARESLLREVDLSWRANRETERDETVNVRSSAGPTGPAALDQIVIPAIGFSRTPLDQVVASLTSAAAEYGKAVEVTPINLVVSDPAHLNPAVSLNLRDVSLRRALEYVAEAVGATCDCRPDAVVLRLTGGPAALRTEIFPVSRAAVLRLTGPENPTPARRGAGGPVAVDEVVTGPLGAQTTAMRRLLELAGIDFEATPGASLAYDGAAIIVTQTPARLELIRSILARYRDVRQVQIEAKFMEVQDGALEELGLNWNAVTAATRTNPAVRAAYTTGNRSLAEAFTSHASVQAGGIVRPEGTTVAADGTVVVTPELNVPIVNNAPQIPGMTDLAATAGALVTAGAAAGELDVNAIVRALSQRQGTDLLSAPKLTVMSGSSAAITVAQEMRYPQSFGQTQSQVGTGNASGGGSAGVAITAGTPQDFTSRHVGVELKVTPTVEDDGRSISLDLNPRVTEFDGFVEYGGPSIAISGSTTVTVPSGFYQPIFSVRDISTRVTLRDGATLMMGGLTREEVKKVTDKVPVLGDLPLLGRLFRSKGQTTRKRNLLIFVTATLVNPGGGGPGSSE
ncbi:MAG: hypothetical protein JSR48_04440 [Verrucomicrobia bacterium]|nr:hypothetical protein [Verrucomicrobiota bacterium]